tara:strand:- start:3341 stop:3733 length:393 start_codon:yes stop_codon:yes gene_type:complete
MIVTANMFFKTEWERYREAVIVPALLRNGLPEQEFDNTSPSLNAYVNHGRWLIKCECNGAEKAWEEEWFMCQSCFNGKHKHKYRIAELPSKRKEIEDLLNLRALPNRNWFPHETISDLEKENIEHKSELL